MTDETPLSSIERHNAMISYCFLAPFMLLSRDERFRNDFVRSHARYAFLIHVGFLLLIFFLIRSNNFASMIIFGATWLHILLFVGFIILLGFLWRGMYSALRGEKPKVSLQWLSWSNLANIGEEKILEESQKTPLILAHIPFMGIYLRQKYGSFLSPGEKFGSWAFIVTAASLWLDTSMTLFIISITLTTFWIVYQSIIVAAGENVRLIGTKFPTSKTCHVILQTVFIYIKLLINHDDTIPLWANIREKQEKRINEKTTTTRMTLPLINISSIIKTTEKNNIIIINAIIINILLIYALIVFHIPILMLLLLGTWWMYWQARNNHDVCLPVITEISMVIVKIIEWKRKKSVPQVQTNSL